MMCYKLEARICCSTVSLCFVASWTKAFKVDDLSVHVDEGNIGCLLNLPDDLLLVIFQDLDHSDLFSLALACWSAAQRVIELAANHVTVDFTRIISTQTSVKLLGGYRHHDATLKMEGSSESINKQLAAMQAVAPCFEVVIITLTVHSSEIRDMHRLAMRLSLALQPLTFYTQVTAVRLAIISDPSRSTNNIQAIAVLTNMPAIKELVLLGNNAAETVPLVNTLCETVVPNWQHSIETVRLYNSFTKDTTVFDTLSTLNRVQIFVHQLHIPKEVDEAFAASLASLLRTGRIILAPGPDSQTLCLIVDICNGGDVFPGMSWVGLLNTVTTQQPFHLHVHTDYNCSELWQAVSESEDQLPIDDIRAAIKHLSITYSGCEYAYRRLQHLSKFKKPITIHVKHIFKAGCFGHGYRAKFHPDAQVTIKIYRHACCREQQISWLCDWLHSVHDGSQICFERYIQQGAEWVLEA